MRGNLRWESSDNAGGTDEASSAPLGMTAGFGQLLSRSVRKSMAAMDQCAQCGREIKVFVSPRRNPHSSKIGRGVSLKDHDLCRRCWRKVMHHQRRVGVIQLPRSLFIGNPKLHSRLLVPAWPSLPRAAS